MRTTLLPLGFALALAGCGDNLTQLPNRDGGGEGGGDAGVLTCVPNLDGKIDAFELRAAIGVPVNYVISPAGEEREVDLAGSKDQEGTLVWDLSPDYASDKTVTLTARGVTDRWYASSFPEGQFATALDATGALEGVYAASEASISLLGIASKDENPGEGQTLLVYDEPITLYRFPIVPGASWISTGEVTNGMIQGLPYAGKDIYEVSVDATGKLMLHDFTFTQVHRVRTRVTVQPTAGQSVSRRQVSFVFECFGEVARATSKNDETEENFTQAAELRRLGQ